jgi:pimeloyl-ACP methyl ester carboxylesterase
MPSTDIVPLGDVPLHVWSEGSGPPVLLLHGWGASSALLRPLAEKLAAHGFAVHVPDLPGFGDTPPPGEAWTIYQYADLVADYVKRANIAPCAAFGHSFGGRICLVLSAAQPHLFTKVILANSAGLRPQLPRRVRWRTTLYRAARTALERAGAHSFAAWLRARYNARYGSADFQAVSGAMRQTFLNVIHEDLAAFAPRIPHPTLLIWGDQDADTPLWMGQKLESLIPDAGLVVHHGAGHYSYLDRLEETVIIVNHFLKN